jgi:hypothetical protein
MVLHVDVENLADVIYLLSSGWAGLEKAGDGKRAGEEDTGFWSSFHERDLFQFGFLFCI